MKDMIVGILVLSGMFVGALLMWGVVYATHRSMPLQIADDPAHRALMRHVHTHGTINLAQASHVLEAEPAVAGAHLDQMVQFGTLYRHGSGARAFYTRPSTARPFLFQPRAYANLTMNQEQPDFDKTVEIPQPAPEQLPSTPHFESLGDRELDAIIEKIEGAKHELVGRAIRVKMGNGEEVVQITSVDTNVRGEIASGPRAGERVELPSAELLK